MNLRTPKILAVLVAGVGDLVLSSMGLRALRNGHPHADFHLLTSLEAAAIARHYSFVDTVWTFPLRQLRSDKKAYAGAMKCLFSLRSHRFDKIVNLYRVASPMGSLTMGSVFSILRSPCKIGHDDHGFGLFLDRKAPQDFFQERHMAESVLEMAVLADGTPDDLGIEVFRPGRLSPRLEKKIDSAGYEPGAVTIAIHPGADVEGKRADPAVFASSVNKLSADAPVRTIILGVSGEEDIAGRIGRELQGPVIDLTGETSLEELVGVMEHIDLLIANDSGPMHIAAALKKPLVALFAGGDPGIFGPYGDPARFRIIEMGSPAVAPGRHASENISGRIASLSKELLSTC